MTTTTDRPRAAAGPEPVRRASRPVVLGIVLTAAYAVLLLMNLSVPQPVDHSRYMDAARSFPSRPHDPIFDHQYLRIGLIAPTSLVMKVFGYSEVTYHAFPIAAALLLFASVYALGVLLFGRTVGAVAAVVLGCVGPVLVAGTELLPDLPATALFTAAVALAVAIRRGALADRWHWQVAIGVLLGWSYLTREFIVFVWPLVAVLLWRRWLWLVPVVLTGLGELLVNARLYGDPLMRLHAGAGLGDLPSRPEVAKTFHDLPLWVYLWRLPQQLAHLPEGVALLVLLALTLAAGAFALGIGGRSLWRRRGEVVTDAVALWRREVTVAPGTLRGPAMCAGWIALLWVPLTLLGGVLNPDHPKLRLQLLRYWYPVFPAFVLGGVAVLWLVSRGRVRPYAPLAALVAVVLAAHSWLGSPRVSSDALPQFRSWLARSDARTVWVDAKLFRVMPLYVVDPFGHRVWHGHVRPMSTTGQPTAGDYVVAYSIGSDACPRCGDAARALVGTGTPPTWHPAFSSSDHLLHVWRVA